MMQWDASAAPPGTGDDDDDDASTGRNGGNIDPDDDEGYDEDEDEDEDEDDDEEDTLWADGPLRRSGVQRGECGRMLAGGSLRRTMACYNYRLRRSAKSVTVARRSLHPQGNRIIGF